MNNLKKYLSFLLCIGMLLSCATAKVAATTSTSVRTEETVKEKAYIIGENTEKRDEYSKTFVMSDHTYLVAVYDEPVHVKNSSGNWEDIDNSIAVIDGSDSVDTQILQNTHGKYTIKLAKNSLNKHLVTYNLGDYTLKWDFVDANKVLAEVISPEYGEAKSNDESYLNLRNKSSQVIYREIYPNVDVRYTISSSKLKEDIILKNSQAQNVFYSEYDIGSLNAVQSNDQTIELYDPNKPELAQIVLTAPVMSDASGNISHDIKIEIVSQNNNKLIIKTTADKTWLTDLQTVYPVTIDPTTYTAQDISKINDTFVSSWNPTTAYYTMGSTWIGKEGANYGTCRILIKYPTLPVLGNGDKVISAKLNMLQDVGGFSSGGPSTLQLNLHEITQSWTLTNTTWNTNVSYDSTVVSDYFVTSAAYNVEYNTWDITKTVQKWYDGTLDNNGVMVKATDTFEAGSVFARNVYVGTGYGINGLYPSLQVTYVNTNGLEDLWTYTTQDMGRAGTAFVNNNTGNLVLMRDDIAISGGKLPVGITSFYNYDPKATGVRYSWKTNYEQTIASVTIGGTNYYKYLDGDGTTVYFKLVSGSWVDELNKGLTLTIDTGSTTARYVVKDKSYNTMEFNSSGYLVKLKDTSETVNSVSITYASTLIDYITDSSGRKFDFTYTSSRLTKIEYLGTGSTALRTVNYAYNDSAKTMTVTYPDTKTVTYYYDAEYKITKAVDIDNSTVEFAYMGSPKIIQTVTEHATDGTTHGNLFTFSYKPNETKITDKYSQDVYYQFDNLGRTICIKDINNAAQYYEYGASGGQSNKLTSVSKLQTTTINLAKNISFESTSDWEQTDTEDVLNTPSYSTSDKLFGTRSISIVHPGNVGQVIYAYENIPVSLTQTTSYTLSAYVKSSVVGAAHISIETNGSPVTTSTDMKVDAADVWQRISATITVTNTAVTSLKIKLVVDAGATVYFDGVQFETGVGMNRYNLVENPSLEYVTSTTPNAWTPSATTSSDLSVSSESVFNSRSYMIIGSITADKSLTQVITVSGNNGDVFSFGGWAKANAIPYSSTRNFQMSLVFKYGTNIVNTVTVPFNNASTAWQYVEAKAVASGTYDSVTVSFEYFDQLNTVYFDGAQVYREEFGKTYSYDDKGNLVSAQDMEGNTDLTTYDNSNQLLKQVNADGTYVSYDYDFFHRVFAAQSSTGTSTYINYDAYGNPISTKIGITELGSKLIAYYKFENNMNDSSGNGYNGVNHNGTFITGKVGQAIDFDQTTQQYAELGNFKVPEIFTMTMWVNNKRSPLSNNECIIGKNTSNGGNQLLFGEYNSQLTSTIDATSVYYGTKTAGYQFLVAVYEKVDNTKTHVKVYKDTYLVYDADITGVVGDTSTGKVWALGMEWDNTTMSDFFKGSVDELAFFKGALDESEIQSLYDQAREKSVVAKYDFNTATGGTIVDNSGNGHTATYTGGVTFPSGKMELNGTTGFMQIPDFALGQPTFSTGQEMSVVMTVTPHSANNFSLFAKHDSSGNNILINGYYGNWHTRIRNATTQAGTLTVGSTYTVVYTVKRINLTQSVAQIYVNGVAQISKDNSIITGILDITSGKSWVIGQEWDGATASDFFDGTIDNLVIYNYELTSKEISDNSSALASGSYVPTSPVTAISVNGYKTINSSATYTSDGNYITSVTDSRGNTSNYNYESSFGRLLTLKGPGETDAEATKYYYNYSANNTSYGTDLLTKVTKSVDGKVYSNSYTYDLGRLTSITHNSFTYYFTYDSFGKPVQVKVGNTVLVENKYQALNGLLESTDYGNEIKMKYSYDDLHRIIAKYEERTVDGALVSKLLFEYTYDNQGNLSSVIDHSTTTPVTYSYFYDFMNRLTKVVGTNSHNMLFTFDSYGRVNTMTNVIDGTSYKNEYTYGDKNIIGQIPGLIYNVKLNGATQLNYSFDQLARLSSRTINGANNYQTTYTYLDGYGANSTTTLLSSMTNGSNAAFNYTYDANGNILTVTEGTTPKASYTYDKMNQLISEKNEYSGLSIDYVYDEGGNIVSRTEYALVNYQRSTLLRTFTFAYFTSWKDQLKSISCIGVDCPTNQGAEITYDNVGNPTRYLNGAQLAWQNGRELASYKVGTVTTTYKYNDSGIRTSKQIGENTETIYYLNGDKIVRQKNGTNILDFFYDENGNLYGLNDGTDDYYYLRNGQNDIIGILDSTGTQVVSYTYDSWGKPFTPTGTKKDGIGADNPFRYRGYYFDSDTGLYYLNSRYYDPAVGRFINADGLVSASSTLLGTNMYGYCENNPVNGYDPNGYFDWGSLGTGLSRLAIGVVSAITGLAIITTTAPLLMTCVAVVGVVAGAATIINGTADIQEAFTTDNYIRDSFIFNGNDNAYEIYSKATEGAAAISTIIGGAYILNNTTVSGPGESVPPKGPNYGFNLKLNDLGEPKQFRAYDKGGDAFFDIDFTHPGKMDFPHFHPWDPDRFTQHLNFQEFFDWRFK